MQHNPSRDIFNAMKIHFEKKSNEIKIILICKRVSFILSTVPYIQLSAWYTSHMQYQDTTFQYQLIYPVWKKIGKGMPKIQSEDKFLTSIKGYNSVFICQNLPICNPRTLLPNINTHIKFEENWLKNVPSREWKRCADGRTDGCTDRRTDRQTDGRTLERNFWMEGIT